MSLMIFSGITSLTAGILFIVAPRLLTAKSAERVRPLFSVDTHLFDHRICTGICLLAVGIFCLASASYVWLRLNL